jgi:DNA-binding CsgD family transcriptional regulator
MLSVENIKKIRITSSDDIEICAKNFNDIITKLCGLRVAASQNIARNVTLRDKHGRLLATKVFGWTGEKSEWWNTEGLALNSPIPMACRYESEPFWINAEGIHTRHPNLFLDAIDLSRFEKRALTHAAIVVPVHLPFGQIGAVSYNPLLESETDLTDKYKRFSDELAIYARTFIRSYVNVSDRTPLLPAKSKLSKREVECLKWAALGKTDYEISLIIDRSRATVRFHIHNSTQKLDAVNKSQAVYKASQLGYLSISR